MEGTYVHTYFSATINLYLHVQWDLSILDTLESERTVLIINMTSFLWLKMYFDRVYFIILVPGPVACVHNREVLAIHRSGLERLVSTAISCSFNPIFLFEKYALYQCTILHPYVSFV